MSGNRQLYFDKNIRNTKTPEEYLKALAGSPYRTHRRMAVALQEQFKQLKKMRDDDTKELLPGGADNNSEAETTEE